MKHPSIPDSPDALLTRDEASAALTASGYRVPTSTLQTKASRGGGPNYRLFNGRAIYRWGETLSWAQSCMMPPRRSAVRMGDLCATQNAA
jgi:hypothetical protein